MHEKETKTLLDALRRKAEGVLLITKREGDEDIVYCGDQESVGYVGWTPRERADANGWSYRASPNLEIAAILNVTDLAWKAVAANYETAGEDTIRKIPLWDALAELEAALRGIGYVA